jgi:hypothetical protein
MAWCTTPDLDLFLAAADGYLRSRAAENTLLLAAAQAARAARPAAGPAGLLFGWWEPPGGGAPRGAFVHDPAVPLLISGRTPELAAALAATLAKLGRAVSGVDAPTEAADAFAAAWSQRAGTAVKVHRHCGVYRLALQGPPGAGPARQTPLSQDPPSPRPAGRHAGGLHPAEPAWSPPAVPGEGRLRVAVAADQPLLAGWLSAFAAEAAERIASPAELAAELISYGGAVWWEAPQRTARFRDAAHLRPHTHLPMPHRRHEPAAPAAEPAHHPVALAALGRPVAGTVRIRMVYTPAERRRSGYAAAVTLAIAQALLAGDPGSPPASHPGQGLPGAAAGLLGGAAARGRVDEVVLITDGNRPGRWGSRLGYELVGQRTVLRFGPATGSQRRLQATSPMPRLPGPPRLLPRPRPLH